MKAKLVLTSKDRQTVQEVPFDRPSITIGRKPSNDLSFNRPEISGSHAAFLFEDQQYFVMDLGSTNGTLLNGAQLVAREKYGLQDQDVVTVAPYTIQFVVEDLSMDTMIEVSAQPPAAPRKVRSGTAPDMAAASGVRTGTDDAQQAAPANPPVTPAANVPPKEEAPPPPPPAPAPAAPQSSSASVPSSVPRSLPVPEPQKSSGAVTDYIWLGIGAILVLAAIGLIIFVFAGL
jgi:pSer/pThr/pTyr-binding forkhead associated (FHA) protein